MKKVYIVKWPSTGFIARKECFVDKECADNYATHLNDETPTWKKLLGYRWVVVELKVN